MKDNQDRLTTYWQSHQGFEALVAQIEVCLVYGHFAKKSITDDDMIDAFIIVIKRTGCYSVGLDKWELLENQRWVDCKFWWKKEYLRTKTTITAQQTCYGMKAIEAEAADDAQYNQ